MSAEPVVVKEVSWSSLCQSLGPSPRLVAVHGTTLQLRATKHLRHGGPQPPQDHDVLRLSALVVPCSTHAIFRYATATNSFTVTSYKVDPTTRLGVPVVANSIGVSECIRHGIDTNAKLLNALLRLVSPQMVAGLVDVS